MLLTGSSVEINTKGFRESISVDSERVLMYIANSISASQRHRN
jgi:hypothetical protein